MRCARFILPTMLLLSACATAVPVPRDSQAAALMSTAQAVAIQETAQANVQVVATRQAQDATAQSVTAIAAQATAEWQSTSDHLSFRATSIAVDATGTAVAQAAEVEGRIVADEATRLAIQRNVDEVHLRQTEVWGNIWPWLVLAVGASCAIYVLFAAARLWRNARPIHDANGRVVALPAHQYELLPARTGMQEETVVESEIAQQPITLPPLMDGHIMIIGVTGDGKSMTLREIIKHRPGEVIVLDPHYVPGAWGNARVIGAGRDFRAISDFMAWMQLELNTRATSRAGGSRHFEPLTVATEEMPAIIQQSGRQTAAVWRQWTREGRKFGLFLAVVTQSTRVRTLGIDGEGDLLENFRHVLYLGSAAARQYPDLTAGMDRPAIYRCGHNQPSPVIIPYDPRCDPESPHFRQPQLAAGNGHATDRWQLPENVGVQTPQGLVSPTQVRQIQDMLAHGESGRAIETAVFGYPGGHAYHMRQAVEVALGIDATNGHFLELGSTQ